LGVCTCNALLHVQEKMEELKKKSEAGQCGGAAARVQDPIRDAEAAWRAGNAALERGAEAAALELYETAAAGYAAAGDAANAAEARKNGGIALLRQGKHAEARPRLEAAVAALTELLGPAHVRTLRARLTLGNGMLGQGELGAARVELEAVAAGLEAALGSVHTSTLAARDSLAILLERAGDHAAAAAAFGQVVTAHTQARGARQPNTSELMYSQAKWAKNLTLSGRAAEALPLLEEAAPALAAKLGADHRWAVFAQRELAVARGRLKASSKKVGLLARLFGGKKSKPKVNARRETTENLLQSKGGMLDGLKPGEAVPSKAAEELCEEQGEYTNNPLCQLL
jgi:tetratricopeptide (TPR) repeat protein